MKNSMSLKYPVCIWSRSVLVSSVGSTQRNMRHTRIPDNESPICGNRTLVKVDTVTSVNDSY